MPQHALLTSRLSLMMFLQFFIWGGWFVTIGNYMTALGMTGITHWAYTVGPIAAIVSPFFLGMVADRYFASERVLGVLHLVGGAFLLITPHFADRPILFILCLGLHSLCYMPTLGLANSLTFHNIQDPQRQFPVIRVFGTIGWIVAGVLVSLVLGADETAIPLYVAGVAALILGLFSFSLPHTPPPSAGRKSTVREILGVDAFRKLRSAPFFIFIASSLLICIPLAAYYNFAPIFVNAMEISRPAFQMSFGQMSEVLFMVTMPFFFRYLGFKWMLVVGMAAWVVRYLLFSFGALDGLYWMILTGILLHGICYDFFFVTGQIYVDRKSTPEIRGQAQGFLVLITYGVGMLIGAQIGGILYNSFLVETGRLTPELWKQFWLIPAGFAAVVMVVFALSFRDRQSEETPRTE